MAWITGTPIHLEEVDISLFSGQGLLEGLVIKNPQGLKTDRAYKFQNIYVSVDLDSALSGKLVLDEIIVDSLEITFEGDLSGSNIGKIEENVEAFASLGMKEQAPNSKPQENDSSKQTRQTDHLIMKNAQVNVNATFLKGNGISIVSSIDQRNTLSYLLEMECGDETQNPYLL